MPQGKRSVESTSNGPGPYPLGHPPYPLWGVLLRQHRDRQDRMGRAPPTPNICIDPQ